MLKKKIWLPILIVLLAVIVCGLFYARQVSKQEPVKVYKVVEVENPETPKPPPPGETAESGHWHGDEWHTEPHAPPLPEETVENTLSAIQPQLPAPVQPGSPQATLPYPMTDDNRHQWETVLAAADEDPELLQTLLPRTEAQGREMISNIANCQQNENRFGNIKAAIYRELCKIAPNDYVWFINAAVYLPQQTDTEKRVVIEYWEEAKQLAKAQGQRIQTDYLGHYYRDLGEYEKAIAEIRDQWDLLQELRRTGRDHRGTFRRFLALEEADRLQKLLDEQRSRQDR